MKYRISVIGLGFVGLPLVLLSATKGFDAIGVDISDKKIAHLRVGKMDFYEPNLAEMLTRSIQSDKLTLTTDFDHAMQNSDISFLTVGTPLKGNKIDLSFLKKAILDIRASLRKKKEFHLLAIKSTLPPLTTRTMIVPVFEDLIKNNKMDIVVNPEFLREGFVIQDMLKPHLIVIGSEQRSSSLILERYYRKFYKNPPEILHTNHSTAELIKYANNAFLATKISFINSIGRLCQVIPESDVNLISYAMGKDPRIGHLFLRAGPGFGGSCLPKDLVGLINFYKKVGEASELFQAVKDVNDKQFLKVLAMMREQGVLRAGKTVTVLGLAFKKGTDDIREAASVKLVKKLLGYKLTIRVHDPMALENFKRIFGAKVSYCDSIRDSLDGSDCCVILTEWDQYRSLTSDDFKHMRVCNVVDTRRVLDRSLRGRGRLNLRSIGVGIQ